MNLVYIGILDGPEPNTVTLEPCKYNNDIGYNVRKHFQKNNKILHIQVFKYDNGFMTVHKIYSR